MHPSHLDILWFNGVREMFSKEISRDVGGEGGQQISKWSRYGHRGGKPQNPQIIAERRKKCQ